MIINPSPNDISAAVVKHGLKAILLGMRLNKSATPAVCMRRASEITGKTFKPRDYQGAIDALQEYLDGILPPKLDPTKG